MPSTERPATAVRAPRRDAAENREALVQAAATILNRDPAAPLEAIATEAGLSRRALYGHFATRDDLMRELALHGATRINAALVGSDSLPDGDPAIQLGAVGARLWAEIDHVRVMARLTLRGPQSTLVGSALEPLRRLVRDIVERGVADGVFRSDIPVNRLARFVENAAISVLDEATLHGMTSREGHDYVVLSALSMAGLGWRDARHLLESSDALASPAQPTDEDAR